MEIRFDFFRTTKGAAKGVAPENRCEVRENHIIIKPPEKKVPDHKRWQFKIGISKTRSKNSSEEDPPRNDAETEDNESA